MMLLVVGCSFHSTPIALRERLAFPDARLGPALAELRARTGCETVILSTCNRVEVYLARAAPPGDVDPGQVTRFLAEVHGLRVEDLGPHLYVHTAAGAVEHLFRVAGSLDSLVLGEGQISAQVQQAYEKARERGCVGPVLNALFQHAARAAKRVRTETGIARGHVSVSSAAVDHVRQVFDHFDDKTVLVIGAGKMSRLTLRHLRELRPQRILVTNRSPDKAEVLAKSCQGLAVPWSWLDEALAGADIVLSATGAPEPIVSLERYQKVLARRTRGSQVILDIAVPRDFDPRIHDGDRTCLFNVDDLNRLREQSLAGRRRHLGAAEALIAEQTRAFLQDWARRRNGPVIERLQRSFEAKREVVVQHLFSKLNARLSEADKRTIEGAFLLFQNQVLHGPIRALAEESAHEKPAAGGHRLLESLGKLFGLEEPAGARPDSGEVCGNRIGGEPAPWPA